MRKTKKKCNVRIIRAVALSALASVSARAATFTWDSSGSHPTHPTDGSGTWDLSHADWSNGTADSVWVNNSTGIAVFGDSQAAAGIITVTTPVTVGGITFNSAASGNYNISGLSGLSVATTFPIVVNGTNSPVISAPLTGRGDVLLQGTGTLTLSGTNSYLGNTNVSGTERWLLTLQAHYQHRTPGLSSARLGL